MTIKLIILISSLKRFESLKAITSVTLIAAEPSAELWKRSDHFVNVQSECFERITIISILEYNKKRFYFKSSLKKHLL